MLLTDIEKLFSMTLSGELFAMVEMKPYLDQAIDYINTELNATYPTFSELDTSVIDKYDYFSDRYIRLVVIPYAAWRFYVTDDEGNPTAQQYQTDAVNGMFLMVRDMLYLVPAEYKADINQGTIAFQSDTDYGKRGMELDVNDFVL